MSKEITPKRNPSVRKVRYYAITLVVLLGTAFWRFWSDGSALHTRNEYREEFARRFSAYLASADVRSAGLEKNIKNDPEYQRLYATYNQLLQQEEGQAKEIKAKLDEVNSQLAPLLKVFTGFRDPSGPKIDYEELEAKYKPLKQQKDDLTRQLNAVMRPSKDALEAANAFISARMINLTPDQLQKVKARYADWKPTLKDNQRIVPEANLVDRCETCHIGVALTGLELTPTSMSLPGQKPDKYARAFVTHPKPELLQIHDPAKFGCTLCHGGNGQETGSVERAHGNYAGWPKPLYRKGYVEGGCQTCHAADVMLAGRTELAPMLDQAKDMFRQGCVGCHRFKGFADEQQELNSVAEQSRTLEQQKKNNVREATLKQAQADVALTSDGARLLTQEAESLKAENNHIDMQLEQLTERTRDLLREEKKVGHNLKEIRAKMYPNWLPFFITGPGRAPGPTIPTEEEIRAMSAYLWQSGLRDPIAKQEPGDPARGKDLVETRGCLGCHLVEANRSPAQGTPPPANVSAPAPYSVLSLVGDPPLVGARFTIALSRAGERDKYDYLVRWISNPLQRLRPYCPLENKDIGPEDYARHGLPYVFDRDHDRCPNDGQIMQVQQESVMPNLRLTLQESRDIASYLITLKKKEPSSFPERSLDDPKLKAKGEGLVRRFGCAACHEIAGLEKQEPTGADLSAEGSKPVEQLDFGQLRKMAESGKEAITEHEDRERLPEGPAKESWYTLKGFIEHKLAEPNLYDFGVPKEKEKMSMPNTRLIPDQTRALTALLLGSRKTDLPEKYIYHPNDSRADIQRGWWVIRKYNCLGCHQILPGQQTALMSMPQYRDHPEQLPPTLVMEGAKVNPEWLAKYLKNPALSDTDIHRNGVRQYLKMRMPTFSFSDNEIRILVRFFQALSHQPAIDVPEPAPVLTAKETETARKLLGSPDAPCLTCHANGDPARDKLATAPDFLLARGRLNPRWLERWIVDPQAITPGTAMPSGFFRNENGRWVMKRPILHDIESDNQDEAKLLVRYIFQLTPQEQRTLVSGWLERARQARGIRQSAYRGEGSPVR